MPRRNSASVASAKQAAPQPAPEVQPDPLARFHPAVRAWFRGAFGAPTEPQVQGWAAIARGESTLLLAPTGSGKTLAAFLFCLNRLLFEPRPEPALRCRVLYISPIKALAVDVRRNLMRPVEDMDLAIRIETRTGDTPSDRKARQRPALRRSC